MTTAKTLGGLAAVFMLCVACTEAPETPTAEFITTLTADGVTVYGEPYFGGLETTTPLILLFHQGGSNGRGEYAGLTPWLNEAGFRAIAWDQRAGGETYGDTNRTVVNLPDGTPASYCDAYADLKAALDYVLANELAENVVVWGSSYSASLVFRLAAEYPNEVAGIISFSPASGGPMSECRARIWVDEVSVPVLAMRPASEMARESSIKQRTILTEAGAEFHVVENGVHGSSMLVDARTEHDMSDARAAVIEWLTSIN